MEAITFVGLDVHKRRDLSGWVRSGPPGRMRPTEVLLGPRRMKFEDVHGRWQQRRLSQVEVAEIVA